MNNKTVPQKILDKFNSAKNILVTVSKNPSVDELSAALALTVLCNKIDKHATAVFSGDIPPAIEFLDPEKTFENNVNSLRDFIIALDKEKADHLRYKLVGDYVKIFITPYRSSLSEKDLEFSMGDYNVEFVFAVGVKNASDLDAALADHGKIVHDATVVALEKDGVKSTLEDAITWDDGKASSYCELVMELANSVKEKKNLLDEQIATALMTGIVATTERFRNDKTTSQNMSMAAQLMSAGANQQLVAAQLEKKEEPVVQKPEALDEKDNIGTEQGKEKDNQLVDVKSQPVNSSELRVTDHKPRDNEEIGLHKSVVNESPVNQVNVPHEMKGDLDDVAEQVIEKRQNAAMEEAQRELEEVTKKSEKTSKSIIGDIKSETQKMHDDTDKPIFGGTLNATSEQAAREKASDDKHKSKTILSHNHSKPGSEYVHADQQPDMLPPINATIAASTASQAAEAPVDIFGSTPTAHVSSLNDNSQHGAMTLADIEKEKGVHHKVDDARAAVQEALQHGAAQSPDHQPEMGVPVPTEQHHAVGQVDHGPLSDPIHEHQPDVGAPLPPYDALPPMPDLSTLPPMPPQGAQGLPPLPEIPQMQTPAVPSQQVAPQSTDPAQFKIPGQQ